MVECKRKSTAYSTRIDPDEIKMRRVHGYWREDVGVTFGLFEIEAM